MRDIKAIRGDFFAHGVPFELLEEFEAAIRLASDATALRKAAEEWQE